jgi:meso-butanediol dehydrogenase / (S,S)-butanediol dehydrogenase / diacetyl reductase
MVAGQQYGAMTETERTALVTGGSGGIGRATAEALAGAGHRVAIFDLQVPGSSQPEDARYQHYRVDVTDAAAVAQAAELVMERWGVPHVLVNAAGISTMARLVDLREDEWDRTMAVNAKGTFLVMKALLPSMIERGSGSVINIASVAGIEGAELLSHYSASKFAVVGLTQAAAKEVAHYGIRVNAICPGLIRTPMQDREVKWEAELSGHSPDEIRQGYVDMTPLSRLGTPLDVARLASFLASDSSDFITGQSIHVDGGLRMR